MVTGPLFRRRILLVMFIIMLCFCADTTYTIFEMHIDDLEHNRLINVTADMIGSYMCLALFASVIVDKRKTDETFHFLLMIFFELLLLNADAANWIVDGTLGKESLLMIANVGLFTIIIMMAYELWEVVKNDLVIPPEKLRIYDTVIKVFAFVGMVNALLTPLTGWAFVIEDGYYVRGSMNFLSNCPVNIMVIALMICVAQYGRSFRRKVSIIIYTVIPMVAMVIQIWNYGYSVLYISMIITLLLIYGNYYVSRGTYILELNNELTEERFAVMYSQIQPHFLYNTLTSIMNIKGNPPETMDAIADFGKYLRGNLDSLSTKNAIPLRIEIGHVENYVSLEKLRFKDRIEVIYDIKDLDVFVPPLALQMVVENAIKHGITMKEEGGTVTIETHADEEYHYITVKDNGMGFDMQMVLSSEAHNGLYNLRDRLENMVGGKLSVESRIGEGTKVVITIPRHRVQ